MEKINESSTNYISNILFLGRYINGRFAKKFSIRKKIVGENNIIRNSGICNALTFNIKGDNNEITIGEDTKINTANIYIRGNNHKIVIGEHCSFGRVDFWIEDENCSIIIQNYVTIQGAALSVTEPGSVLTIEDDCMISNKVQIRTGDSHSIIDLETGDRINKAANVTLKKHVWVASDAIILKGVTIGACSVIGSASVAVNSIPANCIAAGIPAKVIRSNINWDRRRL